MGDGPLVLVTGASGFVGSHLAARLARDGARVRCLVRRSSSLAWLDLPGIERHVGDVTDPESLRAASRGVEIVFHVAALVRARSLAEYLQVNRDGTRNALEACRAGAPALSRFVLVSSQAAAGPAPPERPAVEDDPPHPITDYGRSKVEAEAAVLAARGQLPVTIVRPPSIYGPRDRDVYEGFKAARLGLTVRISPPGQTVNFVHVDDVVAGTILAGTHEKAEGEIFFIGSEQNYPSDAIQDAIAAAIRPSFVSFRVPRPVMELAATVSEWAAGLASRAALLNRQKLLEVMAPYWCLSVEKARRILGYRQSVSLEEGMASTARWYRDHGWI